MKRENRYLLVNFVDEKGLIPVMKPVVFAGVDLADESEGQLYFQDYDSYQQGIRYSTTGHSVECEFDICLPADMGFVFEYERALNVPCLLLASKRAGVTQDREAGRHCRPAIGSGTLGVVGRWQLVVGN